MQGISNKPYYLRWICVAFTHSFGISDLAVAIIGGIIYLTYWIIPTMDVTLWILVGTLGGIVLIRLLLAPYWIHKQQEETIATMTQHLQAKTTQEIFVIEGCGYEFGSSDTEGYPRLDVRRIVQIDLIINAMPTTRVESVQLKLLNNLIDTDWHPDYVGGSAPTGGFYYFGIPDSIKQGRYSVKLLAYAEGKILESEPFEIEVPK